MKEIIQNLERNRKLNKGKNHTLKLLGKCSKSGGYLLSEELQSKYSKKGKIVGQLFGEFEYFQIGSTTFNQLKKSKIISINYDKKFSFYRPDRLIIYRENSKSSVIAVIEDKKSGKFNSETEKLKAIQQCNNYCQELNAKMGIITDDSVTIWINPAEKNEDIEYEDNIIGKKRSYTLIKKDDGTEVIRNFKIEEKKDIPNPNDMNDDIRKLYKSIKEISLKINVNNSIIKEPEKIDPLPLAKKVWQDIWVATGKSPEKCLYNVVELFIFKFLSDLEILTDPNDFDSLYRLIEKGNKPEDILHYYVNNCRKKIYNKDKESNCLFPAGSDDTTIINGTIFVDENGKANTTQAILFRESIKKFKEFENKFGKFSTHNIDKEFKTKLYESFLKQTAGLKALGQFFTPRKVIRSIVEMSGIANFSGGERVCDPFCGVGGFILEPLNLPERANDFKPKNKKITSPIDYKGYDKGFEKDEERTIILAKANMLIYLSELIAESKLTKEFAKNAFNETFHLWRSNLGTLQEIETKEENKFNLILTNPPYVKRGIKTLKNEIAEDTYLKNFYKINGGGFEGLALEWIIKHLKKGGKAFVIIPDGILNRLSDKKLRNFILHECYLDGIISLPQKTFYATPKKTYIIAITKKENSGKKQDFPVFTYLISNIGETLDINRFETPEKNDLPEMVDLFREYQIYRNKDKINELNKKSPRCKIQYIEQFDPEKHWSVDRWWNKEEKIKLGILEEDKAIPIEKIPDLLEEIANNILTFKKEILESNEKRIKIIKSDKYRFKKIKVSLLLDIRIVSNKISTKDIQRGGKYPVFSSQTTKKGLIGYSNLKMFIASKEKPLITFGDHTRAFFVHKKSFSVLDNVKVLQIKKKYQKIIDIEFLIYSWHPKIPNIGYSRHWKEAKNIEIQIPINKNGEFDIKIQKEIAEKYLKIQDIKKEIAVSLNKIINLNIKMD